MNDARAIETLVRDRLTVCTYGGFAPVCYASPDGRLVGLDIAFLTCFAESLGLAIGVTEHTFDGIWTLPGTDVCDVAGAGIMRRPDRPVAPGGSWSDQYFHVQRSLLVRAAERAEFDAWATLSGKTIVVTRGSTADVDASIRYPRCTIQYVDVVAAGRPDPQAHIVTTLLANGQVDAFAEGDVCNQYLGDSFGGQVAGGLAMADCHAMAGPTETFNFVTRDASRGLLGRLDAFIARSQGRYAPRSG